jgi:hypothetical protein
MCNAYDNNLCTNNRLLTFNFFKQTKDEDWLSCLDSTFMSNTNLFIRIVMKSKKNCALNCFEFRDFQILQELPLKVL